MSHSPFDLITFGLLQANNNTLVCIVVYIVVCTVCIVVYVG